jgi:DNA modification methylase
MNGAKPVLQLAGARPAVPEAPDAGEKGLAGPIVNSRELEVICRLNVEGERRYADKLLFQKSLTRSLVSFQANKHRAIYRWFKYKEAFSAGLVEFLLNKYRISGGVVLDPFAGIGTGLFAAGTLGLRAEGIELLPIGQCVIATRQLLDRDFQRCETDVLAQWAATRPWRSERGTHPINELRITKGAYPAQTRGAMERYLAAAAREKEPLPAVLLFALLCVLETISYTRKDGQYLRWDYRSGRRQGRKIFHKGQLPSFDAAMGSKLGEIVADLRAAEFPEDLLASLHSPAEIALHRGSCLDILPSLRQAAYDGIMTSPPYCNRYDYTRTYALELALLGVDEAGLLRLRQAMLSCTVENRAKDLLKMHPHWHSALAAAAGHPLLQSILSYLERQRQMDLLNNTGIPRMVRGYFDEMACVIAECFRVLKPRAPLIMVNDNVRYAGASIPVDIILSDIARQLGFEIEQILVLPNGKGNSSQQMRAHGRAPLRKCVYVWRKL